MRHSNIDNPARGKLPLVNGRNHTIHNRIKFRNLLSLYYQFQRLLRIGNDNNYRQPEPNLFDNRSRIRLSGCAIDLYSSVWNEYLPLVCNRGCFNRWSHHFGNCEHQPHGIFCRRLLFSTPYGFKFLRLLIELHFFSYRKSSSVYCLSR